MAVADKDPIEKLQKRGEDLQKCLPFASRAFVIEFAGTPKSGKSTSVEAIRHFFSRSGFRVHVLTERAALCPIPMKGHLFFNTWCATSMLAELLANVETETDIIIVDRGILDALVWLGLQIKRGELTEEEARTFKDFMLLERWRSLIDFAAVMTVSAECALVRETGDRLSRKPGSIMNPSVLQSIRDSVDEVVRENEKRFGRVVKLDTTGKKFKESGVELANSVLDALEEFLNPEILVVPRGRIEELVRAGVCQLGPKAVESALSCISQHAKFMRRADAEVNDEYVQIIPFGLITYEADVFLFRRKDKDPKSRLFGSNTLWQGCHTTKKDRVEIAQLMQDALMDRIARSLFLSRKFSAQPLGFCWDQSSVDSSRHFGFAYKMNIDSEVAANDLRKKEFRKQRGYGLSGQFHPWNSLREARDLGLEPWSKAIVDSGLPE